MAKKLKDIKVAEKEEVISLKKQKSGEEKKLTKAPHVLRKQKSPIKKIKDIQGEETR